MISNPTSTAAFFLRLSLTILFTFIFFRILFLYQARDSDEKLTGRSLSVNTNQTVTLSLSKSKTSNSAKSINPSVKRNIESSFLGNERNFSLEQVAMTWEEFIALPSSDKFNPLAPVQRSPYFSRLKVCDGQKSDVKREGKLCQNAWSDSYLEKWQSRQVKDLCHSQSSSKIQCYDSPSPKSRFCVIENAMLNFRKVRKRKTEGQVGRSFEKGFLAADCTVGDITIDDIGHLPIYQPFVRAGERCDYVVKERTLLFSHENIRQSYSMLNDVLNMYISLILGGSKKGGKKTKIGKIGDIDHKDMILFNVDGLRRNKLFFSDQTNAFFLPHYLFFKGIVKAQDLLPANPSLYPRICFKQLVLPPRSAVPFTKSPTNFHLVALNDTKTAGEKNMEIDLIKPKQEGDRAVGERKSDEEWCQSSAPPSSLYQRLNLHLQHLLGKPQKGGEEGLEGKEVFNIVLLLRRQSNSTQSQRPFSSSSWQRIISNEEEIVRGLEKLSLSLTTPSLSVQVIVKDTAIISYEDQVREIRKANLLISMLATPLVSAALYLPLGSPRCCGVIELSLPSPPSIAPALSRGYGHLFRNLGVWYEKIDLPLVEERVEESTPLTLPLHKKGGRRGSREKGGRPTNGTVVSLVPLLESIEKGGRKLIGGESSCVLAEIVREVD